MVALAGVTIGGLGLVLPAPESRVARVDTHLDEFAPAWQFSEVHTIRIAAPPARVFEAIRGVTADEIRALSHVDVDPPRRPGASAGASSTPAVRSR